jgi:hypothetical protein
MHIDFQRVTSLPILVPVLPKPSNVPHYTWNFERAEGTLNVAEFAKHEIRNPKSETNLQIQMTKIQNKGFNETFDNIRRRKPQKNLQE